MPGTLEGVSVYYPEVILSVQRICLIQALSALILAMRITSQSYSYAYSPFNSFFIALPDSS